VVESLMPVRGGFIKPFGCGWFIREFLLGHGPEDSLKIDPRKGACHTDIFYYYKIALHKAYAQDAVDYENEQRINQGKPVYSEEEYRERVDYLMSVSLTQPMDGDWSQIYLYVASKTYKRWNKSELPADITVDSLSDNQLNVLKRLKTWLYHRRCKVRLERERTERREKHEQEEAQRKEEQPALFEF
jgi:hypothetical protein